jgi:hypothetical protein
VIEPDGRRWTTHVARQRVLFEDPLWTRLRSVDSSVSHPSCPERAPNTWNERFMADTSGQLQAGQVAENGR